MERNIVVLVQDFAIEYAQEALDGIYDYLKDKGFDFEFQLLPYQDISSTQLREKVLKGEVIDGFVVQEVKDYILKNGLYKN